MRELGVFDKAAIYFFQISRYLGNWHYLVPLAMLSASGRWVLWLYCQISGSLGSVKCRGMSLEIAQNRSQSHSKLLNIPQTCLKVSKHRATTVSEYVLIPARLILTTFCLAVSAFGVGPDKLMVYVLISARYLEALEHRVGAGFSGGQELLPS